MDDLLQRLAGGDRRSIGNADEVVQCVLASRDRFAEIIDGLSHADPLVRMRCADVAEKISRVHPEWLASHKRVLLAVGDAAPEKELRWHIAQMVPRLLLTAAEHRGVVARLFDYLNDESRIVRTCAMQALADFAARDARLRSRLLPLLRNLRKTSSPAVRARARKLVADLESL